MTTSVSENKVVFNIIDGKKSFSEETCIQHLCSVLTDNVISVRYLGMQNDENRVSFWLELEDEQGKVFRRPSLPFDVFLFDNFNEPHMATWGREIYRKE